MGLFSIFREKKKPATATEEKREKQSETQTPASQKPVNDSSMNYKKKQEEPSIKEKTVCWTVTAKNKNGEPAIFVRNGKEWFDADSTWSSPSKKYFIHAGMDANGNEGIALTTATEGVRKKLTEELVEAAVVTDNGTGYALTDEGTLHTITEEKAFSKKLCGEANPNAYSLTPELCAVIYDADSDDETESAYIKAINLQTQKTWKKKIKYKGHPGALIYKIEISYNKVIAIMPDQTIHELTLK